MNIKQILSIATIISIIISIFSTMQSMKHKSEKNRLSNNLYEKTIQYEDDLGRQITEKTQLEITVKELKDVLKQDSSTLNSYEKKIYKIANELKLSDRKAKNLESALIVELQTNLQMSAKARNAVYKKMNAKSAVLSDEFGRYEIMYIPELDTIRFALKQRNELVIDMFKQREKNKKDKEVFILWRWIKKWEYKASIKSLNDSTIIKDFTIIKVTKK